MRTNTVPALDGRLRVQTMRLLASPVGASRAIAQQIEAAGDWPAVVDLCERWRVVPALAMRLRALGLSLPSQQAAPLGRNRSPVPVLAIFLQKKARYPLDNLTAFCKTSTQTGKRRSC